MPELLFTVGYEGRTPKALATRLAEALAAADPELRLIHL